MPSLATGRLSVVGLICPKNQGWYIFYQLQRACVAAQRQRTLLRVAGRGVMLDIEFAE